MDGTSTNHGSNDAGLEENDHTLEWHRGDDASALSTGAQSEQLPPYFSPTNLGLEFGSPPPVIVAPKVIIRQRKHTHTHTRAHTHTHTHTH